jgi:hypothetical protein
VVWYVSLRGSIVISFVPADAVSTATPVYILARQPQRDNFSQH